MRHLGFVELGLAPGGNEQIPFRERTIYVMSALQNGFWEDSSRQSLTLPVP